MLQCVWGQARGILIFLLYSVNTIFWAIPLLSVASFKLLVPSVTIAYPQGAMGFWSFLCGKVSEIRVRVDSLSVSKDLMGDYSQDLEFREQFQQWLNLLWMEKGQCLKILLDPTRALPESAAERE